jgi:hypothetical protein
MIDFSDGSDNVRVDGSGGGTGLGFWFGRGVRPVSAAKPSFGQMIDARKHVRYYAGPATRNTAGCYCPVVSKPAVKAPTMLNIDKHA